MCYQAFVHFACGHSKIFNTECPLATQLQLPLHNKLMCANYDANTFSPKQGCGGGKFYCSQWPDGPFLDTAYSQGHEAQVMMDSIDRQLARVKATANHFITQATARGLMQPQWSAMPDFVKIEIAHRALMQQRAGYEKTRTDAFAILRQGQAYIQQRSDLRKVADGNALPAFVPSSHLRARVPRELMPLAAQPTASNVPQIIGADLFHEQMGDLMAGEKNSMMRLPTANSAPTQLPSPVGSHISLAQPKHLEHTSALPPQAHQVFESQRAEALRRTQHIQLPPSVPNKGGRPRKYFGNEEGRMQTPKLKGRKKGTGRDDTPEETETIRRSTRVRGKKVNYAESQNSGGSSSREPSPDKSDASGFSPAKSELSSSLEKGGRCRRQEIHEPEPEANELRRTSSSLRDQISDYQRRATVMAGHGTPMQQRRAMPGMRDLLNSSPGPATLQATSTVAPRTQMAYASDTGRAEPANNFTHLTMPAPKPYGGTFATMPPQLPQTQARPRPFSSYDGLMNAYERIRQDDVVNGHGSTNVYSNPVHQPARPSVPHAMQQGYMQYQGARQTPQPADHPSATGGGFPGRNPLMQTTNSMTNDYGQRRDSGMALAMNDNMQIYGGQISANESYERLRRSFSSSATFTPPVLPSQPYANTEPKKRRMPTSSPTLPSNKRMRLSLPGDDTSFNEHNVDDPFGPGGILSSPLKAPQQEGVQDTGALPGQAANFDFDFDLGHTTTTPAAAPAPILTPHGQMHYPSQQEETLHEGGAVEEEAVAPYSDDHAEQEPEPEADIDFFSDLVDVDYDGGYDGGENVA